MTVHLFFNCNVIYIPLQQNTPEWQVKWTCKTLYCFVFAFFVTHTLCLTSSHFHPFAVSLTIALSMSDLLTLVFYLFFSAFLHNVHLHVEMQSDIWKFILYFQPSLNLKWFPSYSRMVTAKEKKKCRVEKWRGSCISKCMRFHAKINHNRINYFDSGTWLVSIKTAEKLKNQFEETVMRTCERYFQYFV